MKYLFVGGDRDGEWMAVERETVQIPVLSKPFRGLSPIDPNSKIERIGAVGYEQYRSLRIAGESKVFVVYALVGLSPDEVIQALLDKYKA